MEGRSNDSWDIVSKYRKNKWAKHAAFWFDIICFYTLPATEEVRSKPFYAFERNINYPKGAKKYIEVNTVESTAEIKFERSYVVYR